LTKWRFDIVVINYKRAESFTNNAWRLGKLSERDRVSFLTASPSAEEEAVVRQWAEQSGATVRYVRHPNRGIDQLERCEYFLGEIGGGTNALDSEYIFTMQDHYLDIDAPWSKWGPRYGNSIKGDVVPDLVFDLDEIDRRMKSEGCVAAFADRNNPCWLVVDGRRHIAPSGGNFIVRTDQLRGDGFRKGVRHLLDVCDNAWTWALYVEFSWGPLLFHEGVPVLDIKRNRVFTRFDREDFYVAADDFRALHRRYAPTLTGAVLRSYWNSRRGVAQFVRSFRRGSGAS
jgi:hypothetical protein